MEKSHPKAKKGQAELQHVVKIHITLQAELDALYDTIFAGPSWADFPDEDEKERAFEEARDFLQATKTRQQNAEQVIKHLRDAENFMATALEEFESARGYSGLDMWGGGTMTNMMERRALGNAQSDLNRVQACLSQAIRISPDTHTMGDIDIPHRNMLGDVFFDNIFSDSRQHERIKEAQAQCQKEAWRLRGALDKAKQKDGELR